VKGKVDDTLENVTDDMKEFYAENTKPIEASVGEDPYGNQAQYQEDEGGEIE